MAIEIIGDGGAVAEVSATRLLRAAGHPPDYGRVGNQFAISQISGTMTAGAATREVFHLRWIDSLRVCLVHSVVLDAFTNATGFTAGFGRVQLFRATGWTADGSGGTAADITDDDTKLRDGGAATLLGSTRIASTAALTAGTKVVDAQPVGQATLQFRNVARLRWLAQVSLFSGGHPLLLARQEGLVVRATVPATGTWQFGVSVVWSEVNAY